MFAEPNFPVPKGKYPDAHALRSQRALPFSLSSIARVSALVLAPAVGSVLAQAPPSQRAVVNLVPNPGFEEFRVRPLGWYYRGDNYNRVMRYWHSPTAASPDAYNPDVRVPAKWAAKGFGQATPHGGAAMSGLTVYGCADGKPHCREYLQVQLLEPLVAGQRYRFGVYVAALPRGLRCDGLGAAFAKTPLHYDDDRRLDLLPLARLSAAGAPGEDWTELAAEFEAAGGELYLLFGNFDTEAASHTMAPQVEAPLKYAYYYIDDVSLRKVAPLLGDAVTDDDDDDLSRRTLTPGDAITLRNVYFDTDSDELQPRSFRELDKLVGLMQAYPVARVRIVGHTDTDGSAEYNEDLSRRRAARVVRYLEDHRIPPERLESEGRGQRHPVADNDEATGRRLNRRVVAEVY